MNNDNEKKLEKSLKEMNPKLLRDLLGVPQDCQISDGLIIVFAEHGLAEEKEG